MPAPRKYPEELRERAQRLVVEAMTEEPRLSVDAAVARIGPRVGVHLDTLRGWMQQRRLDAGQLPGLPSTDAARITKLEAENRELKRANEILLAASSFVARELDPRLPWWGRSSNLTGSGSRRSAVCSVRTGCRSPRAPMTRPGPGAVVAGLRRRRPAHRDLRGCTRAATACTATERCTPSCYDGAQVARCTVERLIRRAGLQGAGRDHTTRATRADAAAARPADRVERRSAAAAPNQLWVVDVTYVRTVSGVCYDAFTPSTCSAA